jgi:HlyD family secretion protein
VVEQLNLNAAQQKQWAAIEADLRQKMQAAVAEAGGDRSKMRDTMGKIMGEAFAKLEPSLNPEQKTKLAALRATMAQRRTNGMKPGVVYILGKDGKPAPVPVRTGATDGTSTEVVGNLKPGDQVIVGGGPKAKLQARSPFGPGGGGGSTRVRM